MAVRAADGSALADLVSAWHEAEAGVAPGYLGSRLLADRDDPGRFLIVVDFSSPEEAASNNDRAETHEWAGRLLSLIDGDPEYGNFDEVVKVG
jgi:hypothetical protein